jgi:hypothetical protein
MPQRTMPTMDPAMTKAKKINKIGVEIAMSLLFDAFIYHNAQAAPAPWAGRHLSIKEQICSNKIKLFYSSFTSVRMRIKLGSCLVKGNLVLLDGQCQT